MIIGRFFLRGEILLALYLSLYGCGMGTEVGNGVKPTEEKATGNNNHDQPKDAPTPAPDNTTTAPAESSNDNGGSESAESSIVRNVLLNSCANPASMNFDNVTLFSDRHAYRFEMNADQTRVAIRDAVSSTHIGTLVRNSGNFQEYRVEDSSGADYRSGFACSDMKVNLERGVIVYKATLQSSNTLVKLSWAVTTNNAISFIRMEINGIGVIELK